MNNYGDVFCDFVPPSPTAEPETTHRRTQEKVRATAQLTLESSESLTLFPPDRPRTGETSALFMALSFFSGSRGEPERRLVGTVPACGYGGQEGVRQQFRGGIRAARLQTQCLIHGAEG